MSLTMKPKKLKEPPAKKPLGQPAGLSTSLPAGIAVHDPESWANRERAKEFSGEAVSRETPPRERDFGDDIPPDTGQVVQVGLDLIHPHPKNRRPDKAAVAELAESLKDKGLQQPILVRVTPKHWGLPEGHVQIVFGERRYQAAKLAGWESIEARIRTDLTDEQALELMAEENAKRQDLNPIERAHLIAVLCTAPGGKQGGAGLTREAAAKRVGLESGSAASNLVRLLELPIQWQDRVAAGELPESWARLLLPYTGVRAVLEQCERDWGEREEADSYGENLFLSRKHLEEGLPNLLEHVCRRLDQKRWSGSKQIVPKIDAANPAIRKELGIVELQLPGGKKGASETVLVATNAKAFDEVWQKQRERADKAKAEKSGRDDKPEPLSPAEAKQRAADRTRQLGERIAGWRHRLLRRLCIRQIEARGDTGFRLVMAYAAGGGTLRISDLLCRATKAREQHEGYRHHFWNAVAGLGEPGPQNEATRLMAIALLAHDDRDPKSPMLPKALIDGYAAAIRCDLAAGWNELQQRRDPLLEEFFLLHQSDQLRDLAKELGVHVADSANRQATVKLLLAAIEPNGTRRLPLPKSLKPLAVEKPTRQKSAKGKVAHA